MLIKTEGWPERLYALVEERSAWPFEWGRHDCCQFAAAALKAMTGADARTAFPKYASEKQALILIKKLGGLKALATNTLGDPLRFVLQAQRGDVVLIDATRPMLGICLGAQWAAPGAAALLQEPMMGGRVLYAWRVN